MTLFFLYAIYVTSSNYVSSIMTLLALIPHVIMCKGHMENVETHIRASNVRYKEGLDMRIYRSWQLSSDA